MADTSNLSNYLKDLADAIREKKGTEDQIPAANFDTEIKSIETGLDAEPIYATGNGLLDSEVNIPALNNYFTDVPGCLISDDKNLIVLSWDNKLKIYKLNNEQYEEIYTDTSQRVKCSIVGPYNNCYYIFDFYRDTYLKIDISDDSAELVTISGNYAQKRYRYCPEYSVAYAFYSSYYICFDLSTETFKRISFGTATNETNVSQYNVPFFNNTNILWVSGAYNNIYDRLCKVNEDKTLTKPIIYKDEHIQAVNKIGNKILLGGYFYDLNDDLSVSNKSDKVLDNVCAIMLSDNSTLLLPNANDLSFPFNSVDVYKIDWDNNSVEYIKTVSFSSRIAYTGTGVMRLSTFFFGFVEDSSILTTNKINKWELSASDSVNYIKYNNIDYYPGINKATTKDVLLGKSVESIDGDIIKGSMPNNGELNYNSSTEEQTIPAGYTTGGTIAPAPLTDTEYDECLELTSQILGEDVSL